MTEKTVEEEALALWRGWFAFDGEPFHDDDYGNRWCFFCGELFFDEDDEHAPDCIFIRAKKLVEKADSL